MPQLPVPPQKEYNYVNTLWCTYLISVAASWVAELGKMNKLLLLNILSMAVDINNIVIFA